MIIRAGGEATAGSRSSLLCPPRLSDPVIPSHSVIACLRHRSCTPERLAPYLFGSCRPVSIEPFVREAGFAGVPLGSDGQRGRPRLEEVSAAIYASLYRIAIQGAVHRQPYRTTIHLSE